jgi:fluoride exporter
MEFLVVGLGGFFGAIARYLVYLTERSIGASQFPFGTLFINLFGCFLAGILIAVIERFMPSDRHVVLFGAMGFLGSFTTFSTFSVETLNLLRSNQLLFAIVNLSANVCFGVGAVWLGRICGLRV